MLQWSLSGQRRLNRRALQTVFGASLVWRTAAGGSGETWWVYEYEYFHFECFVVAALVILAMVFDALHHRLVHLASHNSSRLEEGEQHQVHHDNEVTLWESLLNQCSGELMVLGFLAFMVWIANRAGLFYKLAKVTYSDHIRLPPDGYGYLHIVEDVHMQLFIAMLLYVFVLSLVARGTRKAEVRWEVANEHITNAFEVGLDPLQMEGMNPVEKAIFIRFNQCRNNFLVSLEQWRGSWDLLDTELEPLLMLLRSGPNDTRKSTSSAESYTEKEDDIYILTKEWFPFDQYLSLQCRFLVTNLVQIKASTWIFFCMNVLIKAMLMRWTENAEVRHIFDAMLVAVFLGFASLGVWQVTKQREVAKHVEPAVKRTETRRESLMVRESVRDLCQRHSVKATHFVENLIGLEHDCNTLSEEDESDLEDSDNDDDSAEEEVARINKPEATYHQAAKQESADEKEHNVKEQLKNKTLGCLGVCEDQFFDTRSSPTTNPDAEFRRLLVNAPGGILPASTGCYSPKASCSQPQPDKQRLTKAKTLGQLGNDAAPNDTLAAFPLSLGEKRGTVVNEDAEKVEKSAAEKGTRSLGVELLRSPVANRRYSKTGNQASSSTSVGQSTLASPRLTVSFAPVGNGDANGGRRRSSILPTAASMKEVKQLAEEKVREWKEKKDYPWMTALTLLQIMLFSVSLSLVRFIANVHWWQDMFVRPLICTILVSFGAPMFGVLLGRWIPTFSMVLARTEFMQARNVHWVSVILEDHVTGRDEHCRLSSRRLLSVSRHRSLVERANSLNHNSIMNSEPSRVGDESDQSKDAAAQEEAQHQSFKTRVSGLLKRTSILSTTSLTLTSLIRPKETQATQNPEAKPVPVTALPSIASLDMREIPSGDSMQFDDAASLREDAYRERENESARRLDDNGGVLKDVLPGNPAQALD